MLHIGSGYLDLHWCNYGENLFRTQIEIQTRHIHMWFCLIRRELLSMLWFCYVIIFSTFDSLVIGFASVFFLQNSINFTRRVLNLCN